MKRKGEGREEWKEEDGIRKMKRKVSMNVITFNVDLVSESTIQREDVK